MKLEEAAEEAAQKAYDLLNKLSGAGRGEDCASSAAAARSRPFDGSDP